MRRELRLKANRDFLKVYKKGKSTGNKYLVLYYLFEDSSGPTKVGFSISKKVGSAVVRNKLKRQLQEIIQSQERLKDDASLVFVVKPAVTELDFETLRDYACDLLKKGALLYREKDADRHRYH